MKEWLKKNKFYAIGQFFIWIVPLVMLIVMAVDTKTVRTKIELWLIVAFIIYFLLYIVKIKGELGKAMERQLIRDGYTHWWIWLIKFVSIMIPFACVFLLTNKIRECANNQSHEIELFVGITMVSVAIGYLFLIKDSKDKEKEAIENKKTK